MYAYCNNNPVSLVDDEGTFPLLKVALDFLMYWIYGDGKDLILNESSKAAYKFSHSSTMSKKLKEATETFKTGKTEFTERVYFGSEEPDLWLAARNATCEMKLRTETKTVKFSSCKKTLKRVVVDVKVYDTYNFNKGDESGDGVGSILNNIGYWAQERGIGKEFYWEVNYSYASKWK